MLSWLTTDHQPSGSAIIYFHGTPAGKDPVRNSCRVPEVGPRVLVFDRPGYGRSAPNPDLSLIDLATVVLDDLDSMGIDRCSVVGWSGGGPPALACAFVAPGRVASVCLVNSWAPMTPPHPGLPLGVRVAMRAAVALPRPLLRVMFLVGGQRQQGMIDDVRRVAQPWTFDIDQVALRVPVYAWHCAGDPQVPVAPWRGYQHIRLTVFDGDSHHIPPVVWQAAVDQATNALR